MKKLSAAGIGTLPPGDHADPIVPGLFIRVGAKRRSWMFRYYQGAARRKAVIGYWVSANPPPESDHMGLKEARDKAREIERRVEVGAPVAVPKVVHPKDAGKTIAEAINAYEKARTKRGGKGTKSLPEACRVLRFNFAKIEKEPIRHLTSGTMREIRDDIDARAPTMANRFLAYASVFFKWAEDEELIDQSPLRKVRKLASETKRERVLSHDEIRAVWQATENFAEGGESGKAFARLIRFLIASGQRKMEAGNLKHGSILAGYWKQKAEDNKAGREHRIMLPPLALAQVGQGAPEELVFGSAGNKVIGNFDRLVKALRKASKTDGWSIHDLRRSAASGMQELGIAPHIVDSVLNHSIRGVGGVYMHGDLGKLKSEALKIWNDELARILAKKPTSAQG